MRIMQIIPCAFAFLLLAGGGLAEQSDITQGIWGAEGVPESFYWEFWRQEEGYAGVVHTLREGRKETELPVTKVYWDPPKLEVEMAATGTAYRGSVDFREGIIRGGLMYGGKKGPDLDLAWIDPADLPGLRARPPGEPCVYSQPRALDDGWETGDCAEAGIPHEAAEALLRDIVAGEAGVLHSLLLVREGRLVLEEYFHGYTMDDPHRLASVTKSVSSLLIGLAIDAGEIESVDAPLLDFFPDLKRPKGPKWKSQTLRHMLTMSMGLDWGADGDLHGTGPAHFKRVFERKVRHEPGTHWDYHSANVNLLAGVIRSATGLHADEFAEKRLFEPLGISDFNWDFMANDGYRLMDGSLRLRPRDMGKLGMLIRNEGIWRDRRVVSEKWIHESVRAQIATDGEEEYGFLWWMRSLPGPEGPIRLIFANGHGSQFIAWFPDQDLLAVVTGGNQDNGRHFAIGELMARHILSQL